MPRQHPQAPVIASDAQEAIAAATPDLADLQPHEMPPEIRPKPVFDHDDLLRSGLSPQEILQLRQAGDDLVEYDEVAEIARLEKLRQQELSIQALDAGGQEARSHSAMRAYFEGKTPLFDDKGRKVLDRDGQEVWCKRYRFVSSERITVGINGYLFHVPQHKPVMLPLEVIDILEDRARALRRFDQLANIYSARLTQPVGAGVNAAGLQALAGDAGLERFLAAAR